MSADPASEAARRPTHSAGWRGPGDEGDPAGGTGADAPPAANEACTTDEIDEADRVEVEPAESGPVGLVALVESAIAEPLAAGPGPSPQVPPQRVPVRTILASIGIVLAAAIGIELILALQRVIGLIVISGFLAVVLSPAVSLLVRAHMRRGFATGVVFLIGLTAIGGLGYLFIHPLYREAINFSNQLPDLLAKTQAGKGPLGNLIAKYHLQKTAAQQVPKVHTWFSHLGGPALSLARRIVAGLGGLITVMVLTFLLLLEGPDLVRGALSGLPPDQARRIRRIIEDVARSVTGYVIGNATTSVIAGLVCMVTLLVLGVPFAIVFGAWVALVDLLPLVGGLLAGVPTVAFAFLHAPSAGIVTLIVFLVYQQLENHVLNPLIMSRTVRLNPLWVILSVLAGAEIASIAGALLAIPAAGAVQVLVRDLWDERRGQLKDPPTVGEDEAPA